MSNKARIATRKCLRYRKNKSAISILNDVLYQVIFVWITCTGGKDLKQRRSHYKNRKRKSGAQAWLLRAIQRQPQFLEEWRILPLCRINFHLWASPSLITWSRHFIGKADAALFMYCAEPSRNICLVISPSRGGRDRRVLLPIPQFISVNMLWLILCCRLYRLMSMLWFIFILGFLYFWV